MLKGPGEGAAVKRIGAAIVVFWALLSDGSGGIHRVTQGNHLGRNHGRVVAVHENKIDVVEIVPDGQGGWVERPRTLDMKE